MAKRIAAVSREEHGILLLIDVQNDFCDGGALAVPGANEIIPVLNRLVRRFAHVVLTQDWHPGDHQSFASAHPGRRPFETVELSYGRQILWPDHCVQSADGAAVHPDLGAARAELIIRKGFRPAIDSYSAFFENDRRTPTGLAGYLRERGFENVFLAGLAFDFCVPLPGRGGSRNYGDCVTGSELISDCVSEALRVLLSES